MTITNNEPYWDLSKIQNKNEIEFHPVADQDVIMRIGTNGMEFFDNAGKLLVRVDRSGNAEIFGDVNEAARQFWAAVAYHMNGSLTITR